MKKFKKSVLKRLSKANFLGMKDNWDRYLSPRELRSIVIDIGSTCNAKCPFCPRQEKGFVFGGNGIMSEEVFDIIFAQLKDIPSLYNIALYAFGEPLLNKNTGKFIKKLLPLKKRLVLSTNTTNLDKYTEEMMDIDLLQFSIEGWDKESYEKYRKGLKFEDTIEKLKLFDEAIKKRREQRLKTPERAVHLLLTKNTNIEKFIEVWSPYIDSLYINPMYPILSWDKNKETTSALFNEDIADECFTLKERKKLKSCGYVDNILTINSNGKVVLCCSDFSQHLDIGDYRDLKAAFNSKIFTDLSDKIFKEKKNICEGCILYYKSIRDDIVEYFPQMKNPEDLVKDKNIKVIAGL